MTIPKKKQPRLPESTIADNADPDYRSKFEQTVGEYLGPTAIHEPERIPFIQPSKQRYYIPDFKVGETTYIESKGKWDASDRQKHVWLREQHPDKRIILVFQNAKVRLSKRSKTTYGEWATKNNLEWYDWKDVVSRELLKPNANQQDNRNRRRGSRNPSITKPGTSTVSNRSRTKRSTSKGS